MKPMKAFRFQDRKRHLRYPCHVQPKLNGIRMVYRDGQCQSNDEVTWNSAVLEHITDQLAESVSPDLILDGELYVHGWSLQQINSAVSIVRKKPNDKTLQVKYFVFDCVDTTNPHAPFSHRWPHVLRSVNITQSQVQIVPTAIALTEGHAEQYFQAFKDQHFEGMMYRNSEASYSFLELATNKDNRSNDLLKRKDWLDEEFDIIGYESTIGEKGEPGFNMTFAMSNGKTFDVGSGISKTAMKFYADHSPIGLTATVKFEMYSDSGIPLKPTILLVHHDEYVIG